MDGRMVVMELDKRMKRYEWAARSYLPIKTPVILRVDGKAFHTFTRGLKKPYDGILVETMQRTMLGLCKEIEGCVFGYTQSDEITLVLQDYRTFNTAAWYDYRGDKLTSVTASKATRLFNSIFMELVKALVDNKPYEFVYAEDILDKLGVYESRLFAAEFDCRAFSVPKEEVCNNIIWRQRDAEKNSIQMLAQQYYTNWQLQGKKGNKLQDMLFEDYGVNWSSLCTPYKRGTACVRDEVTNSWVIDREMPILTQDRGYVDSRVYIGEKKE